jgi:hypothetical protein
MVKINPPVTSTCGYWMVLNSTGDSIGVMIGKVKAARMDSVNMEVSMDSVSGDFSISLPKRSYTLKAITKIEFETALAFGLGPEYDDQQLPELVTK